jgi:hypothetical protein
LVIKASDGNSETKGVAELARVICHCDRTVRQAVRAINTAQHAASPRAQPIGFALVPSR